MDSKENKTKFHGDIDLFLEASKKTEEYKSLMELMNDIDIKAKENMYSIEKSIVLQPEKKSKHKPFIYERLDEIVLLLKENSITNADFTHLRKNQEHIINEINVVQEQNNNLLNEVTFLKSQNNTLRHLLLKNTTDKRIRSVSAAFLILFSISLALYYINDYELVKIVWAKLGIIISTGVYFIGFFIGKMIKKLKIGDG